MFYFSFLIGLKYFRPKPLNERGLLILFIVNLDHLNQMETTVLGQKHKFTLLAIITRLSRSCKARP